MPIDPTGPGLLDELVDALFRVLARRLAPYVAACLLPLPAPSPPGLVFSRRDPQMLKDFYKVILPPADPRTKKRTLHYTVGGGADQTVDIAQSGQLVSFPDGAAVSAWLVDSDDGQESPPSTTVAITALDPNGPLPAPPAPTLVFDHQEDDGTTAGPTSTTDQQGGGPTSTGSTPPDPSQNPPTGLPIT